MAISDSEGLLPTVLGPPEGWRDLQRTAAADLFSDMRSRKSKSSASKSDFAKLQKQFRYDRQFITSKVQERIDLRHAPVSGSES